MQNERPEGRSRRHKTNALPYERQRLEATHKPRAARLSIPHGARRALGFLCFVKWLRKFGRNLHSNFTRGGVDGCAILSVSDSQTPTATLCQGQTHMEKSDPTGPKPTYTADELASCLERGWDTEMVYLTRTGMRSAGTLRQVHVLGRARRPRNLAARHRTRANCTGGRRRPRSRRRPSRSAGGGSSGDPHQAEPGELSRRRHVVVVGAVVA